MPKEKEWTYVIRPKRSWFEINLREVWQYRDLLRMYVRRDFIVSYKQTVLGPLWYFIQPIFSIMMFTFVFSGLAGLSTAGVPAPLFYMAGVMLWSFFSDLFGGCSNIFTANANVFGKVYFPRLIVPLANGTMSLFKFSIHLVLFVILYLWYLGTGSSLSINWTLILFPVLILMLGLFAMTGGLIISSLTYKYHDLNVVITFMIGLFMYATPVVYPVESLPAKYKFWIEMNPLTPIFETFKYGTMGCGAPDWGGLVYSLCFLIVLSVISVVWFSRVERYFTDSV